MHEFGLNYISPLNYNIFCLQVPIAERITITHFCTFQLWVLHIICWFTIVCDYPKTSTWILHTDKISGIKGKEILYPLEVVYCARGRRETDAYLEYLAWVGSVWQGITLIFYLLQCYVCRGVKLEFKDIDIVGTFQYAVYATLTRFLQPKCCICSAYAVWDRR